MTKHKQGVTIEKVDEMQTQKGGDRMTNTALLTKKIDESGLKLGYIAKCLNITYYGLRLKIQGINEFKQSEIEALSRLLKLTQREIRAIFFARNVDDSQTETGV